MSNTTHRTLVASATVLLCFAPMALAQSPQTQNASFEAALKQYCPAKNLEFLKPDALAKATDDFVAGLAAEQRARVTQLSKPGVDACAGSADDSCRTAAVLGSIRYLDMSLPLAQNVCALPLACRDWFDCSTEQAAAASTPQPVPAPQPRPGDLAQAPLEEEPQDAEPQAAEPPPRPPRLDRPQRAEAARPRATESLPDIETSATAPTGGTSPRDTVAGFYQALGRGDGIDAAHYLIPEKRGRGPFSAQAMGRFYGGLRRPLRLEGVRQVGPSTLRAKYNFVARDGSRCDGDALISVRQTPSGSLIESIRALSGC